MKPILFVHHCHTSNVGDVASGPYHYFPYDNWRVAHVGEASTGVGEFRAVIFGGGVIGSASIQRWYRAAPKLIGWGIGLSRHETTGAGEPQSGLTLLGSRDWRHRTQCEFAPCVSCMSPLFDLWRGCKSKRHIGVFTNASRSIKSKSTVVVENLPEDCYAENVGDMVEAIQFLAESEVIATNSYHGAYWGMLLGRPVLIVNPYSSKFYGFQHQPATIRRGYPIRQYEISAMASSARFALDDARHHTKLFERLVDGVLAC